MPPPPTRPQPQNKTSQEGNCASTILTTVLDNETLTMAITFVDNSIIVAPTRKPPAVATFPLKIGVTPPLPPPLTPPYPPHVPLPLPAPIHPKPLPLIFTPPSPSN